MTGPDGTDPLLPPRHVVRPTVVACVDGGPDGDRALRFAVGEARRRGGTLRVVHVQPQVVVLGAMTPVVTETALYEQAAEVLKQAEQRARALGWDDPDTEYVLARGPRTAAVLEHVDAACVRVVVGRRSSAVDHLLAGSTSAALAGLSPAPVVVVPEDAGDEPTGLVVVGVEGAWGGEAGDGERRLLRAALDEARVRDARLEVVHAWRPPTQYDVATGARVLAPAWAVQAREALAERVREVCPDDDVAWTVHALFERPAVALHQAALSADVLVVGRHGHASRVHRTLGATARALLRTATCPVVVVGTLVP